MSPWEGEGLRRPCGRGRGSGVPAGGGGSRPGCPVLGAPVQRCGVEWSGAKQQAQRRGEGPVGYNVTQYPRELNAGVLEFTH